MMNEFIMPALTPSDSSCSESMSSTESSLGFPSNAYYNPLPSENTLGFLLTSDLQSLRAVKSGRESPQHTAPSAPLTETRALCTLTSAGAGHYHSPVAPTRLSSWSRSHTHQYRKLRTLQGSQDQGKHVFLAEDPISKETMVLKNHTRDQEDRKLKVDQLQHEYNSVKQARSGLTSCPGIIPTPLILNQGSRTTLVYRRLKTDFFDFLDTYSRQHRKMISESIARVWIAQLLHSLSACVAQKVVHRDLKLENLLMDEYGNCVLSDFGLAHVVPATKEGSEDMVIKEVAGRGRLSSSASLALIAGTPMCLPPEALTDKRVHLSKNDMWSLGVVACEIVSNTNPWLLDPDAVTTEELLEATKKTEKGGFKKTKNMSNDMYEFIVGCVCPVKARLTPTEAMELPLFKGISFESVDLFPKGCAREDLKEVEAMLARL